MRWQHAALSLLLALVLTGPARAASPLDDPRQHGMVRVAEDIWADAAMEAEAREQLVPLVRQAQQRVARHYGTLAGAANVVFCATRSCYQRFGAHGLGFSDGSHVLIAPRGRRVAIVAHELAHVELATRLGGMDAVMRSVPQWFDEGLAVLISGAEEFNESTWRAATDEGRSAPALDELADMDSWNRLTGTDGAGMHLTYGTACHELRRWTQAAGPEGPRNVVSALRNHEPFAAAYRRIEAQSDPLPVFAAHDGQAWTSANAADGGLTPQTIRASVARP
ncbi:hypothetical protein [Nitrogeniibacter aestuarii]|uniref:hypothetical protein n=1 Tax=Nitrogeniibacter aestuarii TaxID=2815343 RepID=UPI001E515B10|nr:hypothetical protein [Nitrogeniibacter aestuarii]